MIEKLKTINPYDETEIDMDTNSVAGLVYENTPLVQKINELVDAVNELQTRAENVQPDTESRQENVQNIIRKPLDVRDIKSYMVEFSAEQRNYDVYVKNRHLIGKLCKFKFGAGYTYGILTNIKRKPSQWAFESNGRAFSYCEPVKPDDDIIYKGE